MASTAASTESSTTSTSPSRNACVGRQILTEQEHPPGVAETDELRQPVRAHAGEAALGKAPQRQPRPRRGQPQIGDQADHGRPPRRPGRRRPRTSWPSAGRAARGSRPSGRRYRMSARTGPGGHDGKSPVTASPSPPNRTHDVLDRAVVRRRPARTRVRRPSRRRSSLVDPDRQHPLAVDLVDRGQHGPARPNCKSAASIWAPGPIVTMTPRSPADAQPSASSRSRLTRKLPLEMLP